MPGRDEELRLRLFGQDVSAGRVLDAIRAAADRAEDELNNLDPQVDMTQLRELRDQLDRLNRRVTARVDVDIQPADVVAELRELRGDLDWFDGRTARARLSLTGADQASRQLADLSRDLMWFDSRDRISLNIDVDINDIHEVELLNDLLDRLDRDRTVNVRVDTSGGAGLLGGGDDDGRIGALAARAAEAAKHMALLAARLGAVGAAGVAAAPAVAKTVGVLAEAGTAAVQAAPALVALGVAGKVVQTALAGIFAEGNRMREVLQPIADGLDLAGKNASIAASRGLEPLVRQFQASVWPEINHTFIQIGESVGRVARGFLEWADSARGVAIIKSILTPIWQSFDDLEGPVTRVGISFAEMLGRIMGVSTAAGSAGLTGVLNGLADVMDRVDARTVSEGLSTLRDMASGARGALEELRAKATEAFAALEAGFNGQTGDGGWTGVFEQLGASAAEFANFVRNDLLPTVQSLSDLLTGPFGSALLGIADVIHGVVYDALSTLLGIVRDDLVPLFNDHVAPILNDYVVPAFQALADLLRDHVFPAISDIASAVADHLGPGLDYLKQKLDENKPQLEALGEAAKKVAGVIVDVLAWAIEHNLIAQIDAAILVIGAIIDVIGKMVIAALELAVVLLNVAADALGAFKTIFDGAVTAVKGITDVWGLLPGPLGEPFRKASEAVATFKTNVDRDLTAAAGTARDTATGINGWLDGIRDKTVTVTIVEKRQQVTEALNSLNISKNAAGGRVQAGEWSWVGEEGPELVQFGAAGRVYDSTTSTRMSRSLGPGGGAWGWDGAATPVQVVNVYVAVEGNVLGERDFVERIAPKVRNAITTNAGSNARRTGLPGR